MLKRARRPSEEDAPERSAAARKDLMMSSAASVAAIESTKWKCPTT